MTRCLPLALLALLLVACGAEAPASVSPSASPSGSPSVATDAPSPETTPGIGDVIPAPGSASVLYPPDPGAIVVAIEAGHGGCLDWGVPDPQERGPEYSEKAVTMAIARALSDRLAADGVRPLLVRDGDEALAGDHYPALGCEGAPFRDVNGDGLAGFGPDLPEATRTRDELQARLDRANLAGADVLVSIHVDSITDAAGNLLPVARTETFYTDETPWGAAVTEPLARAVQESLVDAMDEAATYDRQDRGINAHNLYIVAPPLGAPTPERPDPLRQPTRGALMPAILVEVGTITLPEEHELLLTEEGVGAAAQAIFDGLATWFGDRALAGRVTVEGGEVGTLPAPVPGAGPPFVAESLPTGPVQLRVTNTGTRAWSGDAMLVGGWIDSDEPYVYGRPDRVEPTSGTLPPLAPGESVVVSVDPGASSAAGALAWFSLVVGTENLADHGVPALQLRGAP